MDSRKSVPQLRFLELDQKQLGVLLRDSSDFWWVGYNPQGRLVPDSTPVHPCVRCGRITEDPTRNPFHLVEEYWFSSEEEKLPVCRRCEEEEDRSETETEMLAILERKLGLSEKDREALKSFIETVFTDPKKILKVEKTESRVSALEGQIRTLWMALSIAAGLIAVLIAAVIALALAS